ncbi:MAG: hypothetical protein JSS28_01085 [Proteobacteria bacterium]|nr:hypothetical protein [Pseudomonadota bacterium]
MNGHVLDDTKVHVKLKIAALWASTMFCYIYGDYFELYIPGKMQGMLQGRMEPLGPVTQEILLGTSVLMAVPSLMVFLSLVLPPLVNKWLNIGLGVFYTAIMLLIATQAGWIFYVLLAIIEATLTSLIVWFATRWPKQGQC